MNDSKPQRKWMYLVTLVSAILLSSTAIALQKAEESEPAAVMLSTDVLIGQRVLNDMGHENASVKELMIDPQKGCIEMVVVALGTEDASTLAVPWSSLAVDPSGVLRLVATEHETEETSEAEATDASSRRNAPEGEDDSRIEIVPAGPVGVTTITTTEDTPPDSAEGSYVPNARFTHRYDRQTVKRFEGVVVGVVVAPLEGRADDVSLLVDVGAEDAIRVHLGPEWYVDQLTIDIEPGDAISVTGSEIVVDDETVVLAAAISNGDMSVALRKDDGTPLW